MMNFQAATEPSTTGGTTSTDDSDEEFEIIFEYIHGKSLRDLLKEGGPLTLGEVQRWFSQIASALAHAHENGIVHRDVKPENIIVTMTRNHCYLVDFGIALSLQDRERVTPVGYVIGTPGYMSPEQENGETPDPSDDLYVLANCLYEALSGHRIPPGAYQSLSQGNEAIPPSIDKLIQDCIAPKLHRMKNASEFERRLNTALAAPIKLSEVIVSGKLHEIVLATKDMDADDFMRLQLGQRLAFLNKALDVISKDEERLLRAKVEFLVILPRLTVHVDADVYKAIISHALPAGFDATYGTFVGNPRIQSSLEDASELVRSNHAVFCDAVLAYLESENLPEKHSWFYHGMRDILLRLMTNTACSDANAVKLNRMLGIINQLQSEQAAPIDLDEKL
jgi:serine/threonine-protein kinase